MTRECAPARWMKDVLSLSGFLKDQAMTIAVASAYTRLQVRFANYKVDTEDVQNRKSKGSTRGYVASSESTSLLATFYRLPFFCSPSPGNSVNSGDITSLDLVIYNFTAPEAFTNK